MTSFIGFIQSSDAAEINNILKRDQAFSEFMLMTQALTGEPADKPYSFRVNLGNGSHSSLLVEG